jgi:3-amino-5-hydroxybenzoic acid synthesis related protein
MNGRVSAVLWDLDGTLVDSFELLFQAYSHAVRTVLGWELARERLYDDLGPPMPEHVRKYSVEDGAELEAAFREYYHAHHDGMVTVHRGVREALVALREHRVAQAVVTSRGGTNTHNRLETLGLLPLFEAIVTEQDAPRPKPHPDPIEAALQRLNVQPAEALMVGDDPVDLAAAAAAGVASVAALWGARDREALLAARPDFTADTASAVVALAVGGSR